MFEFKFNLKLTKVFFLYFDVLLKKKNRWKGTFDPLCIIYIIILTCKKKFENIGLQDILL